MNLLWIFHGWWSGFIAWIRQPSQDAVVRAERDRKRRALRAARRGLNG